MVDLLEMDLLKQSGSMEQRLSSLEEQVGPGGSGFWGPGLLGLAGPCRAGALRMSMLENNPVKEVGNVGVAAPNGNRCLLSPPERSSNDFPGYSSHPHPPPTPSDCTLRRAHRAPSEE